MPPTHDNTEISATATNPYEDCVTAADLAECTPSATVRLWPNPFQNELNAVSDDCDGELAIYSTASGELLLRKRPMKKGVQVTVDTSELPGNTYYRVTLEDGQGTPIYTELIMKAGT